jgi:RHS repeat-associated protein
MPPRTTRHSSARGGLTCLLGVTLTLAAFLTPVAALGQQTEIWFTSFEAAPSQPANGFRYNTDLYTQDAIVDFDDSIQYPEVINWVEIEVNGVVQATCSTGSMNCEFTLTQTCSKVSLKLHAYVHQGLSYYYRDSNPIDVYVVTNTTANACRPRPTGCDLGSGGGAAGKPCNVASGRLWYETTDAQLSGPFGLRFSRRYDNQSTANGDMGYGWRHDYGDQLLFETGQVVWLDQEERRIYFPSLGNGSSAHDQFSGADLQRSSDGSTYALTAWDGSSRQFDSAGRLTSVHDRIGNAQTITRDATNRISTIADPLGRTLTFGYDTSNRIISITSSVTGATLLSFTYDSPCGTSNLCSATMPDGRIWTYLYDGAHNLTQVTDPARPPASAPFVVYFLDVAPGAFAYDFINLMAYHGITAGCGSGNYCPDQTTTRAQMAVFLLVAEHGAGYTPPACDPAHPRFADVPCPGMYTNWIEQFAREGITAGCGNGNYCPNDAVLRQQMAVFLLATRERDGSAYAYAPPACTTQVFGDVPCSSGFAPWIDEIARRGVTAGCGGGNFCPSDPVTRAQMAVFITATWSYGTPAPTAARRNFIYDQSMHLVAESDLSAAFDPTVTYEHVWLGDRPVADEDVTGGQTSWTVTDHLGTPFMELNDSSPAGTLWRIEYEPYGWVYKLRSGADRHQPLRFPGQEAEQLNLGINGATEKRYNVFRWYHPKWGRYSQGDPLGTKPSLNLFAYTSGRPSRFTDRLGLLAVDGQSCSTYCTCQPQLAQAAGKYDQFFADGFGDRHPACRQLLTGLASSYSPPNSGGITPFGCMLNSRRTMTVKCSNSNNCGGPPNNLPGTYSSAVIWIGRASCNAGPSGPASGICGSILNTLFHEALHNCGLPSENPPGSYGLPSQIADPCVGP